MGLREICWVVYLAGLPFSNFLNQRLDLWHGHAAWAEIGLAILAGLTFCYPTQPRRINRPFGTWVAYLIGSMLWLWYHVASIQQIYPVSMIMPLLHLLSLIAFVWIATLSWTPLLLHQLLLWIGRIGLLLMAYGVLQLFNLDQFFDPNSKNIGTDPLVGTIGNYDHFASYLLLLLPILLWRIERRWHVAAVLTGILILLTKSEAGMLGAVCGGLWCCWFFHRRAFWVLLGLCLMLGCWKVMDASVWASLKSRWEVWNLYWQLFSKRAITGLGPGAIFEYAKTITDPTHRLYHWRHVHNEWFQLLIEQGVIGASLVGWIVWDMVKRVIRLPKSREVVTLSGMLLGLSVNSFFSFPWHLWMIGSLGLLAYCGLLVLDSEMV